MTIPWGDEHAVDMEYQTLLGEIAAELSRSDWRWHKEVGWGWRERFHPRG